MHYALLIMNYFVSLHQRIKKLLMMKKRLLCAVCALWGAMAVSAQIQTNAGVQYLQCMQKDMSTDFYDLSNTYFFADSLVSFDAQKGEGLVQWKRYRLSPRQATGLCGCRCWTFLMQRMRMIQR